MSRIVRTYGLWTVTAAKGAHDKRVFAESKNGDWPLSVFQRRIGVKLFPSTVYRRTFSRMGEWKGFFMTHAAGSAQRRLPILINRVRENLEAPRARVSIAINASRNLVAATGHVALWAPHLRLLAAPPGSKLIARIHVKQAPPGESSPGESHP